MKSILILGDSVAWGHKVSNDKIASTILNAKMTPLGYQVINAGVPGYGTDQEVLRIRKIFSKLPEIEKAILIVYINDFDDIRTNVYQRNRKPIFTEKDGALFLHAIPSWDLRFILSQSALLKKLFSRSPFFDNVIARLSGDLTLAPQQSTDVFKKLVLEMRDFFKGQNISLAIILSPSKTDWTEKSERYLLTESLLKETGIPYRSLLEVFKDQDPETLYADEDHYSEKGNTLLAEYFFNNTLISQGTAL